MSIQGYIIKPQSLSSRKIKPDELAQVEQRFQGQSPTDQKVCTFIREKFSLIIDENEVKEARCKGIMGVSPVVNYDRESLPEALENSQKNRHWRIVSLLQMRFLKDDIRQVSDDLLSRICSKTILSTYPTRANKAEENFHHHIVIELTRRNLSQSLDQVIKKEKFHLLKYKYNGSPLCQIALKAQAYDCAKLIANYSLSKFREIYPVGRSLLVQATAVGDERAVTEILSVEEMTAEDLNSQSTHNGETIFFHAVRKRNMPLLNKLLADPRVDKNARNMMQETPFMVAMRSGFKEICQKLSESGVDKEARDANGYTAFHHVCERGSEKALLWAVDPANGINIHARIPGSEKTGLHILCESCSARRFDRLYKSGAPIEWNLKDANGNTCLHMVSMYGSLPLVKKVSGALPELLVVRNNSGYLPFHLSLTHRRSEVAKELFRRDPVGYLFTQKGDSCLMLALRARLKDQVTTYLNDPFLRGLLINLANDSRIAPISVAADSHCLDNVKEMLKYPELSLSQISGKGFVCLPNGSIRQIIFFPELDIAVDDNGSIISRDGSISFGDGTFLSAQGRFVAGGSFFQYGEAIIRWQGIVPVEQAIITRNQKFLLLLAQSGREDWRGGRRDVDLLRLAIRYGNRKAALFFAEKVLPELGRDEENRDLFNIMSDLLVNKDPVLWNMLWFDNPRVNPNQRVPGEEEPLFLRLVAINREIRGGAPHVPLNKRLLADPRIHWEEVDLSKVAEADRNLVQFYKQEAERVRSLTEGEIEGFLQREDDPRILRILFNHRPKSLFTAFQHVEEGKLLPVFDLRTEKVVKPGSMELPEAIIDRPTDRLLGWMEKLPLESEDRVSATTFLKNVQGRISFTGVPPRGSDDFEDFFHCLDTRLQLVSEVVQECSEKREEGLLPEKEYQERMIPIYRHFANFGRNCGPICTKDLKHMIEHELMLYDDLDIIKCWKVKLANRPVFQSGSDDYNKVRGALSEVLYKQKLQALEEIYQTHRTPNHEEPTHQRNAFFQSVMEDLSLDPSLIDWDVFMSAYKFPLSRGEILAKYEKEMKKRKPKILEEVAEKVLKKGISGGDSNPYTGVISLMARRWKVSPHHAIIKLYQCGDDFMPQGFSKAAAVLLLREVGFLD